MANLPSLRSRIYALQARYEQLCTREEELRHASSEPEAMRQMERIVVDKNRVALRLAELRAELRRILGLRSECHGASEQHS